METYRCEKIWLWRQRTTDRPPVRTGRKGLSRFYKGGNGDPRIAACVCLGETFTSSPKGSSWSLSSKDIEFRLLAWSHFQDIFTQLSILGQIDRKHNKLMTNTKVGPIFHLGLFYLLERFSIDDGDGREQVQKINNRFITKNNNFARASRFLLHFFVVTARLRREKMCENTNCTFYGGRNQATTNFSFSF